jgi:hypothetical protein
MHGPMNVKSPNNTSKWQIGCNSAFKGLKQRMCHTFSQEKNSTLPVNSMAINHLPLRQKEMNVLVTYVKWKIFNAKYDIHSFNRKIY